jgi:hypothetical protein
VTTHNCTSFWGPPALELSGLFDALNLGRGAASFMAQSTYCTLLALQREIELAAGPTYVTPTDPRPWFGDTGNCDADTQARIRQLAILVLAGFAADQWDAGPNKHNTPPYGAPGWMSSGGGADDVSVPTASAILGVRLSDPPFAPPPGLIGRVRNSLGS